MQVPAYTSEKDKAPSSEPHVVPAELTETALFEHIVTATPGPALAELTAPLLQYTHAYEGLKVFYVEENGVLRVAACQPLRDAYGVPLDHAELARAVYLEGTRDGTLNHQARRDLGRALFGDSRPDAPIRCGGTRFIAETDHHGIVRFWFEPSGSYGAAMRCPQTLERLATFHASICIAHNLQRPIHAMGSALEPLAQRVAAKIRAHFGQP